MTVTPIDEKPTLIQRAEANVSNWTGYAKETVGGIVGSDRMKVDGAKQQLDANLKNKQLNKESEKKKELHEEGYNQGYQHAATHNAVKPPNTIETPKECHSAEVHH